MVKTLQKSSFPEPVDRFSRNLVHSIGPIIVCSNDHPRLTLTYEGQGHFFTLADLGPCISQKPLGHFQPNFVCMF